MIESVLFGIVTSLAVDILKAFGTKLKAKAFVAGSKKSATAYFAREGLNEAQAEALAKRIFKAVRKNKLNKDFLAENHAKPRIIAEKSLETLELGEKEKSLALKLLEDFYSSLSAKNNYFKSIEGYSERKKHHQLDTMDRKLDEVGEKLDTLIDDPEEQKRPKKYISKGLEKPANFEDPYDYLTQVKAHFFDKSQNSLCLTGMGGVGKSTLARSYAKEFQDQYAGLYWLEAETQEGLRASFLEKFGPIKGPQTDPDAFIASALQAVSSDEQPLLLIYDNLVDETLYKKWGHPHNSHRLITTRGNLEAEIAPEIALVCWEPKQGREYLRKNAACNASDTELEGLSEDLGGLPLALVHAASYLHKHKIATVQTYRQQLAQKIKSYPKGAAYPHSVYATFVIAIESLQSRKEGAQAITLLTLFAQMGPEPVALELIRNLLDFSKFEAGAFDALNQASLVMVEGEQVRMHRLVALVTQEYFSELCAPAQEVLLHWLVGGVKDKDPQHPDNRSFYEQITALVRHLKEAKPQEEASQKALFWVRNQFAVYLQYLIGNYPEAGGLYEQNLALAEENLSEGLPTALNNLAGLYQDQGDYARTLLFYERALAIDEKALGSENLHVVETLNNMAVLYQIQGKYGQALPLCVRALAIREKALGPEHPNVATTLNNLAEVYRALGDYTKALPLFERALAIREKVLGPEHPDVATTLNNLALLYQDQGDYAKALPRYKQALAIREKTLAPEHPFVASSLNNLAGHYQDQGDYARALPLYKRALAIREKALGPEHPDVATTLNNLAALYKKQGNYAKAFPLYEQALKINGKTLGPDHPFVAATLNNLAELCKKQGNYARAFLLYEQALKIVEKALGPEHANVAQTLNNLAGLYKVQGDYAKALPLYERALAVYEKALVPEHANVAHTLSNLAGLYYTQGDYARALPLSERAVTILRNKLPKEHPDLKTVEENYARLVEIMGKT